MRDDGCSSSIIIPIFSTVSWILFWKNFFVTFGLTLIHLYCLKRGRYKKSRENMRTSDSVKICNSHNYYRIDVFIICLVLFLYISLHWYSYYVVSFLSFSILYFLSSSSLFLTFCLSCELLHDDTMKVYFLSTAVLWRTN